VIEDGSPARTPWLFMGSVRTNHRTHEEGCAPWITNVAGQAGTAWRRCDADPHVVRGLQLVDGRFEDSPVAAVPVDNEQAAGGCGPRELAGDHVEEGRQHSSPQRDRAWRPCMLQRQAIRDRWERPHVVLVAVTLDDALGELLGVLRPVDHTQALPAGHWTGTLHLPHGWRTRPVPEDLTAAAERKNRDIGSLDPAELRYALTFLGEATTPGIRQARIEAIVQALPQPGRRS